MREIPKDIIDDVNKVVNELIVYKNEKNLTWTGAYKDVLKKLKMEDRAEECRLLTNVVTMITRLGYDIMDTPFKLDKYI